MAGEVCLPRNPVCVRGFQPFRSFGVTSRQLKVSPSSELGVARNRAREDCGARRKSRLAGRTPRPGSRSDSRALTKCSPDGSGPYQVTGSTPAISLEPGIVAERYDLIEERDGKWTLTSAGKDLLSSEFGATERGIDLQEGMGEILKIIQVKPNARRGDLLPGWRDFVVGHSNVQQESVVKHFLYNRLQSLLDRKLIERDGQRYRLTRRGEEYLESLISGLPDSGQNRTRELLAGVEAFNRSQREMLRERLENMDPYAFERLICDLLTEMGYEDVEVTQPSNDKGVDVKAVAQFGITTINEVIQVKRHRANIQRPVLDMLRGSLHRFKAQKGTIITTGDYGKGAKDAAFEMGAAPITLINGDTLIDLLLQHEIGVKKKTVDYYEVDESAFQAEESEEIEDGDGSVINSDVG